MVLPMSDLELRLVRALDRCDLKQGSADERFCDTVSTMSRHQSQILLTEGQRAYLWRIAYRYRHLLAGDLATKAETKACPYRKSDPDVLVMQSAEMGLCEDSTDALNFARNRRVLA